MGLWKKKTNDPEPEPMEEGPSAAAPEPLLPPSKDSQEREQGPLQPGGKLRKPHWENMEVPEPRAEAPKQRPAPIAPPGSKTPTTSSTPKKTATDLKELLREAVKRGASDLHLSSGVPPTIRLDGYLIPLAFEPLNRETCEHLALSFINPVQRQKFNETWELDLSLEFADVGRFRVNLHRARGGVEAAFRIVNDVILPLRRLGLPGVVEEIARKHSGLVLVTGPTGSGKSTTLAAIVDQINNERQCMIITVEDPIEYVHSNKRSIIKQREVSSDTKNFTNALRHVLRQDPDVVVIGEMRDLETIQTALVAAETGHLVFGTLHTPDAMQTVDRMIDVFPPHQQEQTRIQVANTLQAVVSQQLIPVPGNRGRVVAVEIMIANIAVKKIIRTSKTEQLFTTMQTNWELGMVTMDKSLKTLFQQGLISFDDAISRCRYPNEFENI